MMRVRNVFSDRRQRTGEFTRDVLTAELPLRDAITPADRVGAAPEWGLAIVGVAAWAGAWFRARRKTGEHQAERQQ